MYPVLPAHQLGEDQGIGLMCLSARRAPLALWRPLVTAPVPNAEGGLDSPAFSADARLRCLVLPVQLEISDGDRVTVLSTGFAQRVVHAESLHDLLEATD